MTQPYIEPEIDQLARKIRLAFFEEKSRGLKKKYKPSPRHDDMEFYRAAARNVIQLKCDPGDFVRAAVRYCMVKGGPFASQLGGPVARNWYQQHCKAVGLPDPVTARGPKPPRPPGEPEPEPFEVKYTCDVELQQAIETVLLTFNVHTGSMDPKHPGNLAVLRDPFYELPVEARALMGDDVTLKKFGKQILEFYTTQPNFVEAARRRDFPIGDILNWIKAQLINDI